jgi:transcriptional regulator with GAF, ATPase, and Fis domain
MIAPTRTPDRTRPSAAGADSIETLLLEVLTDFIDLPADQLGSRIEDTQRRVCAALGLDRSTLWQRLPDHPDALRLTHYHQPASVPAPPPNADAAEMFPWAWGRVRRGISTIFSSTDELPPEAVRDRESFARFHTQSSVVIPLSIGGKVSGALTFATVKEPRTWPPETVQRLHLLAQIFAGAIGRVRGEEALRASLAEVNRLREELHQQNAYLVQEVKSLSKHARLIGRSPALLRVLAQVEQVAATNATVLLLGETGTGKELIASEIHELSSRRERVMVRVNCSAIPATLIESELFGREKGAYTGALSRQIGRFEMADGSTLFLDEIGELPPEIQVKLLRVLQERQIERLGSPRSIPVDVRIIAATNRDLERHVREGRFREDLFYRLNVFPIRIPPLRERREDIPALVSGLVSEFATAFGKYIESIDRASMDALQRYPWPGNIRELRNVVERAMIVATGPKLRIDPPHPLGTPPDGDLSARAVEREHILRVLAATGGRIRGKGGAAETLQLKPTTLESRMAKLGIQKRRGPTTT